MLTIAVGVILGLIGYKLVTTEIGWFIILQVLEYCFWIIGAIISLWVILFLIDLFFTFV